MNVAHVVAYASADGEYGGPTRVAATLVAGLRDAGLQSTLVAGSSRTMTQEGKFAGNPAILRTARPLLKSKRFATLVSPSLALALIRSSRQFDVFHVHLARDLLTLPIAVMLACLRRPLVLHTHGMIKPDERHIVRILDRLITRPVLRAASRIVALSDLERGDLIKIEPSLVNRIVIIRNPLPETDQRADPARAQEVLFLARLDPRKRPLAFVELAHQLRTEFPAATFTLVGPDGGEGAAVRSAIVSGPAGDRIRWEGPCHPERTFERMAKAAVYVLPAYDEPWGMTVLEAMSVGLPCVITDSCGLADEFRGEDVVSVTSGEVGEMAAAVGRLLQRPSDRAAMGDRAAKVVRGRFSVAASCDALAKTYEEAISQ